MAVNPPPGASDCPKSLLPQHWVVRSVLIPHECPPPVVMAVYWWGFVSAGGVSVEYPPFDRSPRLEATMSSMEQSRPSGRAVGRAGSGSFTAQCHRWSKAGPLGGPNGGSQRSSRPARWRWAVASRGPTASAAHTSSANPASGQLETPIGRLATRSAAASAPGLPDAVRAGDITNIPAANFWDNRATETLSATPNQKPATQRRFATRDHPRQNIIAQTGRHNTQRTHPTPHYPTPTKQDHHRQPPNQTTQTTCPANGGKPRPPRRAQLVAAVWRQP